MLPPLLGFGAVALAAAKYSNATNVSIIMGFHVLYLIYAIGYGVIQASNIKKTLDDKEQFSATSFYDTWILGYGVKWATKKTEKNEID
jgi:hypothetical protein